jgi:hypothetical protein
MADLVYFQHRDGGAIHGFTLPLVPDLEQQVRKGIMVPVGAPPEPRTLDLPPGMVEDVLKEEKRLSRKKKREELLKELAELGEEPDDEDGEPEADEPNERVRAAARRLPEVVKQSPPAADLHEEFEPIEPPSPELPKADGLSGGGTKTRGRRP